MSTAGSKWSALCLFLIIQTPVISNALTYSYAKSYPEIQCMTQCQLYSYYNWCWIGWGWNNGYECTPGTQHALQYFTSKKQGQLPKCTSFCGYFGMPYMWCFTGANGLWDYCSIRENTGVRGEECTTPCVADSSGNDYTCTARPATTIYDPLSVDNPFVLPATVLKTVSCSPSPINQTAFDEIREIAKTCKISRRRKRVSENVVRCTGVENLIERYERMYPLQVVPVVGQVNPVQAYVTAPAPPIQGLQPILLTLGIRATINRGHLRAPGTRENIPTAISRRMIQMNNVTGDVRGHLLASCLGGPTEAFNFVPQSGISNSRIGGETNLWFRVEQEIHTFLRDQNPTGHVTWTLIVTYGDLTVSRRPTGLALRFQFRDNQGLQVRDSGDLYFSNDPEGDSTI